MDSVKRHNSVISEEHSTYIHSKISYGFFDLLYFYEISFESFFELYN